MSYNEVSVLVTTVVDFLTTVNTRKVELNNISNKKNILNYHLKTSPPDPDHQSPPKKTTPPAPPHPLTPA